MKKLLILSFFAIPGFLAARKRMSPASRRGSFTFDTDKPFLAFGTGPKIEEPIVTKKRSARKKFLWDQNKKVLPGRLWQYVTVEYFFLSQKPELPNTFVRDIYWYDFTRHEIRRTSTFDPKKGKLLHASTENAGHCVAGGRYFFKGTKHGRWMR